MMAFLNLIFIKPNIDETQHLSNETCCKHSAKTKQFLVCIIKLKSIVGCCICENGLIVRIWI